MKQTYHKFCQYQPRQGSDRCVQCTCSSNCATLYVLLISVMKYYHCKHLRCKCVSAIPRMWSWEISIKLMQPGAKIIQVVCSRKMLLKHEIYIANKVTITPKKITIPTKVYHCFKCSMGEKVCICVYIYQFIIKWERRIFSRTARRYAHSVIQYITNCMFTGYNA